MTERERRALNLPPTEAELARMKEAEERLGAEMAPVIARITESSRLAAEAMDPILASIKSMTARHESYIRPEMVVPITRVSRTRLDSDQFDLLIKKVSERSPTEKPNELLYDWKAKEFSRIALGEKIRAPFTDKEDNKRRRLVEKLLRTRSYVGTKVLADFLSCPQKQVGNIVAIVNDRLMVELTLSEPLIDSLRGSGYRINPAYTIYQKK